MLVTYFYHKTTRVPGTGLTATVTLVNANRDTKLLDNVPLTELTSLSGAYVHPYQIDKEIDYIAYFSCTDTNYLPSIDKLYIPASGVGGGGGSINISGITTSISNIKKALSDKMEEEHKKTRELIISENNDTNSHIELAKGEINDKIESIEIPEAKLEEKEAKKAVKLLTTLDKKVSGYIDSEMSDKEELGAIAREFTRLEMEDAMKEKEKEIEHKKRKEEEEKMEAEQDEKLLEEIKAEFAKADEKEKEDKRKELEKELEEIEKEKQEIEKELKTL